MNETVVSGAVIQATLASLRSEGAQRMDPARFYYMEELSERLHTQRGGVQQILEGKLMDALTDYVARFRLPADRQSAQAPVNRGIQSLTALNHYIRNAAHGPTDPDLQGRTPHLSEMKSVRQFRQTWSRISAEDRVERAIVSGPENAGPLNSHMLVIRTLALMRELSPDYLQRFLSQMDNLLWLDTVSLKDRTSEPRPNRKAKARK